MSPQANLSSDQANALARLTEFIEAPYVERPWRTLQGLAGTGKSHMLAELVRRYPWLRLAAFTGKACAVLRKRVNVPVDTLHSVIYDFRGLAPDDQEPERLNPIFVAKGDPLGGRCILIDEASMIGHRVAQDLLDTGARVVAAGDPGQLPPVRDHQFFNRADYTLTHIHRQALDSAIIRQAHNIRNNGRYEADGPDFRVIGFAEPSDLLAADILLCWRNRTRQKLNAKKRSLLGLSAGEMTPGEPVMCLRNDHRLQLFNGAIYQVAERRGDELYLLDDGREVAVPAATVEGFDPDFAQRRYDDDYLPFAVAYSCTTHKAQGSEWPSVLVFDEAEQDWRPWMYTAVTRASERCTIVRWRS